MFPTETPNKKPPKTALPLRNFTTLGISLSMERWLILAATPATSFGKSWLEVSQGKKFKNGGPLLFWLVVEPTPLKNISQNGNLPQIGVKIKHIWNHHLVFHWHLWLFNKDPSGRFFLFQKPRFPWYQQFPLLNPPFQQWQQKIWNNDIPNHTDGFPLRPYEKPLFLRGVSRGVGGVRLTHQQSKPWNDIPCNTGCLIRILMFF